MKNKRLQWTLALCVLPVLLGVKEYISYGQSIAGEPIDRLYLLVPDNADPQDPVIQVWMNAAEEQGLHLALLHDSELLNPLEQRKPIAGLIVPDLIHRSANATLIAALHDYVHNGGHLMVVYDACTWDLDNHFARIESRLSDLVGVSYALYDHYRTDSIHWSAIWGDAPAMKDLGIPPGKYVAAQSTFYKGVKTVAISDSGNEDGDHPGTGALVLSRYEYGNLSYPSFRTGRDFDGTVLLHTSGGVGAGIRQDNRGEVLFVNFPLSYLAARTDALLMHAFLRYFSVKMIGLPYLAPVPDGVGGLVFNWHIDAKAMAPPLEQLIRAGIFNHGPYSVHFTAGPDDDQPNDGKGLNVGHDPDTDRLIRELQARGHTIGSHGGWIHNYFGEHVSENNEQIFAPYIQWNINAIEKVTGKPITEYSAPLGNQPRWVSQWLEKHHIDAYYFAGDTGMGPTQVFRDSERDGKDVWAFPIVHLGRYASLEEMGFANLDSRIVENWLTGVADFVADDRSARLIYTHPLGATKYISALHDFLRHTDELQRQHRFQWYTMSQLATFLNSRKHVQWAVTEKGGTLLLKASSPENLSHDTWFFPKSDFEKPKVKSGSVQITSDNDHWLLDAGDCKEIVVEIARK